MSSLTRGFAVALLCTVASGTAAGGRAAPQPTSPTPACDPTKLTVQSSEGVTVQGAAAVGAGGFVPPRSLAALQTPAFCRVQATATPTASSSIAFEVWVPHDWNGKVVVTGNGGYSHALSYRDASRVVAGKTLRTRPLCPYPRRAVYSGTGSIDDAAYFVCR